MSNHHCQSTQLSDQRQLVGRSAVSKLPRAAARQTSRLLTVATSSFSAAMSRTHRLKEQRAKLIDQALEKIEQ